MLFSGIFKLQVWRAQRIVAEEELLLQAARHGSQVLAVQAVRTLRGFSEVFCSGLNSVQCEYHLRPAACTGLSRHAQHWPKGSWAKEAC